ncbi:TldD/PmbA family protein [Candidatus Nitrospira bockiana]
MSAPSLLSRELFERVAARVLESSPGEHTLVAVNDLHSATTRFANNQIVQNLDQHRVTLTVTVAFGRRHGTATSTDFGDEAVRDMVKRAAAIARVAPEDPEYLPPLPPQSYPALHTLHEETARAGPERRRVLAGEAIDFCRAEGFTAAGIVSSSAAAVGVAADSGLLAYEPRTEARFSLTALGHEGSGWAANVHRSIEELDVREHARIAVEKAGRVKPAIELPPGRYTVILEPAAVAGLIGPMIWMMDAKSYDKRTSPFMDLHGRPVVDARLTLRQAPDHPALLGGGFNGEGLAAAPFALIQAGTLRQLRYDRFTAHEHGVPPTPAVDAPLLEGAPAEAVSLGELIRSTDRGVLVTNFWYIRSVNPLDLTLTGMTRDGTFLIEGGMVTAPLVNFRWHDSPLRVLNLLGGFTEPMGAVSNEQWKMMLPALRLLDFNFSSVTRF